MITFLRQYTGRLVSLFGLVVCITLFLAEPLTQHSRIEVASLIGGAFIFWVTVQMLFLALVAPEESVSEMD